MRLLDTARLVFQTTDPRSYSHALSRVTAYQRLDWAHAMSFWGNLAVDAQVALAFIKLHHSERPSRVCLCDLWLDQALLTSRCSCLVISGAIWEGHSPGDRSAGRVVIASYLSPTFSMSMVVC